VKGFLETRLLVERGHQVGEGGRNVVIKKTGGGEGFRPSILSKEKRGKTPPPCVVRGRCGSGVKKLQL